MRFTLCQKGATIWFKGPCELMHLYPSGGQLADYLGESMEKRIWGALLCSPWIPLRGPRVKVQAYFEIKFWSQSKGKLSHLLSLVQITAEWEWSFEAPLTFHASILITPPILIPSSAFVIKFLLWPHSAHQRRLSPTGLRRFGYLPHTWTIVKGDPSGNFCWLWERGLGFGSTSSSSDPE